MPFPRAIITYMTLALAVVAPVARAGADKADEPKPQQPPQPPPARRRPPATRPVLLPRTVGELKKVEAKSIVLLPKQVSVKGGEQQPPTPAERTLAVDENTKVFVGEVAGERKGPRGDPIRSVRYRPGKLSDLKAGQQVMLVIAGDRADRIEITPADKPAGDGGL